MTDSIEATTSFRPNRATPNYAWRLQAPVPMALRSSAAQPWHFRFPPPLSLSMAFTAIRRNREGQGPSLQSLQVAVGVNVGKAGTYGLFADLVDSSDNHVAHANMIGDLPSGAGTLTLTFPGADIHTSKHDGPYTLTHLMLTDRNGATLVAQEAQAVYTTAAYQYRDFRIGDLFLPLVLK